MEATVAGRRQTAGSTDAGEPPIDAAGSRGELKSLSYELFILLVSILSIVNVVIVLLPFFDQDVKDVVLTIDGLLSIIFLVDFTYRFRTARPRRAYFWGGHGWADLVSATPFPGLRLLRLFRIVPVTRQMRTLGGRRMVHQLIRERAGSAFGLTVFLVIVVLEVAASLIVRIEEASPNANIRTAGDALWWGYVSITTVGYGDKFPVTLGGRIIGVLLLTAGVGLFSVFTGFLARYFLTPQPSDAEPYEGGVGPGVAATRQVVQPIQGDVRGRVVELVSLLQDAETRQSDIRGRLAELERLLDADDTPRERKAD